LGDFWQEVAKIDFKASSNLLFFSSTYTLQRGTDKQMTLNIHNPGLDGLGATLVWVTTHPSGTTAVMGRHTNRVY